ncbi:MAG: Ig-like domain-containing protein [Clostridia bacterium]|nr:Ig-like domain-containing protein [Clostridia bacterium]
MKKTLHDNLFKILLAVLTLSLIFSLATFMKANESVVWADGEATYFRMEYGASIRYKADSTGIRFRAKVGAGKYAEVVADENKTFGMLIVPNFMLTDNNIKSDYIAQLHTAYPTQTLGIIEITNEKETDPGVLAIEGDGYLFSCALTNIKYNNVNRDFFGIAFIKTAGENDVVTYEYATFNQSENVRSVVFVASNAINREATNQEKSAILQGFIDDGIKKAAGLTKNDPVPQINVTLYGEDKLENMTVGQKARLNVVMTRTVEETEVEMQTSVKYAFTSSDPAVATVTPDGIVTATGAGETTITATNAALGEGKTLYATVTVQAPEEDENVEVKNLPAEFYTTSGWTGNYIPSANDGVLTFADSSNKSVYNIGEAHTDYSIMLHPGNNNDTFELRFYADTGASHYYYMAHGFGTFFISNTNHKGSWITLFPINDNQWNRVDVKINKTSDYLSISLYLNGEKVTLTQHDPFGEISYVNGDLRDTSFKDVEGGYFGVKSTNVQLKAVEQTIETRTKIACVGDSTTYGQGATISYPELLQQMLGDEDYVVNNYGASSTTVLPASEIQSWTTSYVTTSQYTSALNFKPDVVVLNFGLNDANYLNWGTTNGVGAEGKAKKFYNAYVNMIKAFKAVNPSVRIILCTPSQTFDYTEPHYTARGVNVDYAIIPTIVDLAYYECCEIADINGATRSFDMTATAEGLHYKDYTVFAQTVYSVLTGDPKYVYAPSGFVVSQFDELYPSTLVPELTLITDANFFDYTKWTACWGNGVDNSNSDVHVTSGAIAFHDCGAFAGVYEWQMKASTQNIYVGFGVNSQVWNTVAANAVCYGIGWRDNAIYLMKGGIEGTKVALISSTLDFTQYHTYKLIFNVENGNLTISVYVDGEKITLTQYTAISGITYNDGTLTDATGNLPTGTYVQLDCYGSGCYVKKPE